MTEKQFRDICERHGLSKSAAMDIPALEYFYNCNVSPPFEGRWADFAECFVLETLIKNRG